MAASVSLQTFMKWFCRRLLTGICPNPLLAEKASIDEAFIDLTLPVRKVLLERFPHLATVPSNAPLGLDTPLPPAPPLDWKAVDWGIVPRSTEVAAQVASASQEASASQGEQSKAPAPLPVDEEVHGNGWGDMALWVGGQLMEQIRKAVEDQLGYTTSAVRPRLLDACRACRSTHLIRFISSSGHRPQQGSFEAVLGLQEASRTDGPSNERRRGLPTADEVPKGAPRPQRSSFNLRLTSHLLSQIRFLGGKLGMIMAEEYGAVTVGDLL